MQQKTIVRHKRGLLLLKQVELEESIGFGLSNSRLKYKKRRDDLERAIGLDDFHDMVEALATALDAKNTCMCGHSERVAELSLLLARVIDLPEKEQRRIHIGAHLHDIGKIGIPDSILNKKGRLTPEEYDVIRRHPEIGSHIVGKLRVFEPVVEIVRHHHERIDGKGYPDGLAGEQIALGTRIVAVADAFDAMTSRRPYRPAMLLPQAWGEIYSCRGTQFDPLVVEALRELLIKPEWWDEVSGLFPQTYHVG